MEPVEVRDRETLTLTEWELANLHLPPVTTVTLYEGTAPVGFLRRRIASILEENPWLTSRIVKRDTTDGVVALAYSKSVEVERAVEQHFRVYEPRDVGFSLGMSYEELVRCLLPVQCARSKPATDKDVALFKVAVVPIEAESTDGVRSAPLQQRLSLPGFALVVSMNHTLGDGHTYYSLYNMLSMDSKVEALDPVRVSGFEAAKTDVIGEKETAMLGSAGFGLGILVTYLGARVSRRAPQNVQINEVDPAWLAREKDHARQEAQVPFVSSNDVLTSWFFRSMRSDTNIMVANFRSRQPCFWKSLHNKTSIITNWARFYGDAYLQDEAGGDNESVARPKLHFPIMESDGLIASVWNNAIVFRPRAGQLGVLLITRPLDDGARGGEAMQNAPLGSRIV